MYTLFVRLAEGYQPVRLTLFPTRAAGALFRSVRLIQRQLRRQRPRPRPVSEKCFKMSVGLEEASSSDIRDDKLTLEAILSPRSDYAQGMPAENRFHLAKMACMSSRLSKRQIRAV